MKRVAAFAMSLSLSLCAADAAANTPADYAYVFPIETSTPYANAGNSAWRVDLTPAVYRWLQDADLRDLEIFNAAQHPVPMGLVAGTPTTTAREERATLPALEVPASASAPGSSDLRLVIDRDTDGRLRRIDAGEQKSSVQPGRDWIVDASRFDHAIDTLALTWGEPATGIVARFGIEASDDLEHWRNAGGATVLALEQDGARLERRDIPLGGVRAKYLRLHRGDDGAPLKDLRVEARSVERTRELPARVWIGADRADAEPAPPGVTRFDYTLPAPLPIDVARIALASDNALAKITLFARLADSADGSWTRIAMQTAFRLRQGTDVLRNDDITISLARRAKAFRIESANAIAEAPDLMLGYRPDSVVFLAEGAGPYVLAAGSASARHADYPVDAALASLRASLGHDWQPPPAKVGQATASGGEAALKAAPAPVPWRRWLLWAILVGGAALIAALAISLLRGAKSPPP
jgi:uncharacterized protein DUF3999